MTIRRHHCCNYDHHFHACFLQFYVFFGKPHFPLFLHRPLIPLACHDCFLIMLVLYDTCEETDMKSQGSTSCITLPTLPAALRKPAGNSRYSSHLQSQTMTTSLQKLTFSITKHVLPHRSISLNKFTGLLVSINLYMLTGVK